MKGQKGFTLIELMIVVAIIGVLSAFAIPAYQSYVAKSEASTGIGTLRALLTNYDMYVQENGKNPNDLSLIGTSSTAAGSLGSIEIAQTSAANDTLKFTFTGSGALSGATASYVKSSSGWNCTTTVNADYKPKGCN
ncbi:TPA: pilin [Photobacterium damselae]